MAKSVCVSLWDRNGDGEVSFEEAVSVTGISRGSFEGYDIYGSLLVTNCDSAIWKYLTITNQ